MEEVDIDIFRMTTCSTNENVDGKGGRKEHAFFRPDWTYVYGLGDVAAPMSWHMWKEDMDVLLRKVDDILWQTITTVGFRARCWPSQSRV